MPIVRQRYPCSPRVHRPAAHVPLGQENSLLPGVGSERVGIRVDSVQEPWGVPADAHTLNLLAAYSGSYGQLLDEPLWWVQIKIVFAGDAMAEIEGKTINGDRVALGETIQPRGEGFPNDRPRMERPASSHINSRSKSRRRCVGPA